MGLACVVNRGRLEQRVGPRGREAWKDARMLLQPGEDGDVEGGVGGRDGDKIHPEYLASWAERWMRKGAGWRGRVPAHRPLGFNPLEPILIPSRCLPTMGSAGILAEHGCLYMS